MRAERGCLEYGPAVDAEDFGFQTEAGPDPAGVIRELSARAPLIHVKDGPCTREADMQALGEGIVDFNSIVDAAEHVEWWIVELDRCATDMMEAVIKSYAYMVGEGFARGNKG